ncbi:MAG TPA: UTP--glucose-1-phosphate uridylyltransferase [Acidimicrobiales bacterium]|jgi:UTP--glucose-1-phosphate uridylyltransferase
MPPVTVALIPAAGLGTRFLPATKAVPKELLPVVDRPAIEYVAEELADAGIDDLLLVTAHGKESIVDHFDVAADLESRLEASGKDDLLAATRHPTGLLEVHAIRQGEPLGLGHAVGRGRAHVGGRPFVVALPDELFLIREQVLAGMIKAHQRTGGSVIAVKQIPMNEVSAYGAVDYEPVDGETNLVRLRGVVEKPKPNDAPSDHVIVGRYIFTPAIFGCIDRITPGAGGELQLTDAIALLLEEEPVYGYVFSEGRYDIGRKDDYLRATIELGLAHPELGAGLADYLRRLVGSWD